MLLEEEEEKEEEFLVAMVVGRATKRIIVVVVADAVTHDVVGKGTTPLRSSNDDDEYYWTKRRKSSVFGMMNTRRRENRMTPNKSAVGVQQWDVICVRDDDDDESVSGKYRFATVETRGKDGRIECVVLEKEVRDDLDEIEEESSSNIIFVETQETRVIREEDVMCVCSDFILFEQRMDQDRISNPHGEHSTNIWVAKKKTSKTREDSCRSCC